MGTVPCPGGTSLAVRSHFALRTARPPRAALLALLLVALWGGAVAAQPASLPILTAPTRVEATRAIPFDALQDPVRSRVARIVAKPTIYRRLPPSEIACDRELFAYLVQYPEIVVNIWQMMDVTKVTLNRINPAEYEAADGAGTTTRVMQLVNAPGVQLYFAEGSYNGPLLRQHLTGSGVLLLRSSCGRGAAGDRVSSTLDVFVSLDHVGAEVVAKTLQPLVGRSADHNFAETARFVAQVSQAAESNGPGMQRLAANLSNVQPGVRDGFAHVVDVVYQRAVLRGGIDPAPNIQPRVPAAVASGLELTPASTSDGSAAESPSDPRFRR